MNGYKCTNEGCGKKLIKAGRTKAGAQRWACRPCGYTMTRPQGSAARHLQVFLDYVTGRSRQVDKPGAGRTFRRMIEPLWKIWPLPQVVDEVHHVVFVDGIYLHRAAVVLIARSEHHVLGWHLARREHSEAWEALMGRIAAPDVVVCDGGSGFEKARKKVWFRTRVQRCLYHAFVGVQKHTTFGPNLQAGVELLAIASALFDIDDHDAQAKWQGEMTSWCGRWKTLLAQKTTHPSGRVSDTHERLVKARNSLNTLIRSGRLFTYLDPELCEGGTIAKTNNRLEGFNSHIRTVLRDHRGWSLVRQIKAIMWFCLVHTQHPPSPTEVLKTMPTDDDIEAYYQQAHRLEAHAREERLRYLGDAIEWHELHRANPYRMDWD